MSVMTDTRGDEQGYNGWANYETWAMALWIDNDQASYEYARELVASVIEYAADGTPVGVVRAGDALSEWLDELNPLAGQPATVFTDLLGHAFSRVEWTEIVDAILSEQ